MMASPEGGEGIATINQDARLCVAELAPGEGLTYPLQAIRYGCLHVVHGKVTVSEPPLAGGDAAIISEEARLIVRATGDSPAEVLFFDLA